MKEDLYIAERFGKIEIPSQTKNIGFLFGEMEKVKIEELKKKLPKTAYLIERDGKHMIALIIVFLKEMEDEIIKLANNYGFKALNVKKVEKIKVEKELKAVRNEISNVERRLRNITKKYKKGIEVVMERLKAEIEEMEIIESFDKTKHTYIIQAWVPSKNVKKTINTVSKGVRCFIKCEKPKDSDDVPILLRNPNFIKPFEFLTKLYGTPSYKDIDPTPIIAFTFPLIFGTMFGDVGHGIMLSIFALFLRFVSKNMNKKIFQIFQISYYDRNVRNSIIHRFHTSNNWYDFETNS